MNEWEVCRLCLQSFFKDTMKSIPDWTYNSIPFDNIYFQLVGINFTHYSAYSGGICAPCEDEMIQAYKFRIKCLETEEKLKNLAHATTSNFEFISTPKFNEEPTEEQTPTPAPNDFDTETESSDTDETEVEMIEETTVVSRPKPKRIVHKFSRKQMEEMASKNIQCRRCQGIFKGIDAFKCHECNVQDEEPPKPQAPPKPKKLHTCAECGQSFSARSTYNSHIDRHSNNKRYPCSYCGKKFSVWLSRRTHIYKVHLKKTHCDCPHCGRGFYSNYRMQNHIKADHLDIEAYQCVVCGKTFAQSASLHVHEKTHQGPKRCDICGKELKSRQCLRKHMRTHTQERNYICPVCSKGFTCNFSMKTHVRKLHPDDVHLLPPDGTIVNKSYLQRLQEEEEENLARIQTSNK